MYYKHILKVFGKKNFGILLNYIKIEIMLLNTTKLAFSDKSILKNVSFPMFSPKGSEFIEITI